jgi:uncharacterized protein (TIGR00725 family)
MDAVITYLDESWFLLLGRRKRDIQTGFSNCTKPRFIAIFGGAEFAPQTPEWQAAYQVGQEIARRNGVVFNGGYAGVMEASCAGARAQNGLTVGVTCDNLPEDSANKYVVQEWKVSRWDQRLLALVWLADGYVVMPGSSGTLVELAMVIETQRKGFIPARPIACCGKFWQPVLRRIDGTEVMIKISADAAECAEYVMGGGLP